MSDFLLNINNALNSLGNAPASMLNSQTLLIDDEFAALIPPLTPEEFAGLETSILAEGCRDALIVWGNIIVDGHNRYRICTKHGITYRTQQMVFTSRDEAKLWMLRNQLSRRNLNDFQRVEMVRKCEAAVKAQAKERQGTRTDIQEIFPECEQSRDTLGAMAGVSGKTYEHATAILDKAPEEVVQATRKNELSINAAYQVTKLPQEQQQEVSRRISQGENARKVVAEVKQQKRVARSYWDELIPNAEKAAREGRDVETVIAIMNQALEILKAATGERNQT